MRNNFPLLAIVVTYLFVGGMYAAFVPPWQAPDEPAHYNYVRQLANGRWPMITAGDYDQAYLDEIRGAQFAPQYPIDVIEYEDWQPPLYYLLLMPIFQLTNGSLLALRLASLLIGAGVVVLAHAIALEVFPARRWLAWTTAVFVAFLPQHLHIMASVNNDALAELLIAAVLLVLIRWTKAPLTSWQYSAERKYLLLAGLFLGLGLVTKLTAYLMLPVAGVVLLWRYWGHWDDLFPTGVLLFAPALLIGSLWWGRNLLVYSGFDPLAMAAHDAVVVGQPRTAEWMAQFGLEETVRRFARTTFISFWGQFGWMAVPLLAFFRPLLLLTGIVAAGLLLALVRRTAGPVDRVPPPPPPAPSPSGKTFAIRYHSPHMEILPAWLLRPLLLLLLFLLTLGVHIYYNLTFVQHQGRYLFPALAPIGIGVAVGLGVWWEMLPWLKKRPFLLPLGLWLGLALLDIYALFRFILPALA